MNLAINTLKTALDKQKHHVTSGLKGQTSEQSQANVDAELAQCPIFVQTLSQLRNSNSPTARTFFDHSTNQVHHLAECPVRTHERDLTGEFHDGLDDVADGEAGMHHIVRMLGAGWARHHHNKGDGSDAHADGSGSEESPTSKAPGFDVSQISSMVGVTEALWKKFKRRGKHDDDGSDGGGGGDGVGGSSDKKHVWEEDHGQDVEKAGGDWQGSHDKDVEMGRDMSSPSTLTKTRYGMEQLEKYITWCSQGGEVPV